jgi:hypothetical protein
MKSTLPVLNIETQGDIVQDKNLYVDEAPKYKAESNSKIQFQGQRKLEFEVNPDIDTLHQMFPSISMDLIFSKYIACGESLNSTIEELLIPIESSVLNTQDPEQWPSIVKTESGAVCSSEVMTGMDTSTAHHHATTPLRSVATYLEHTNSQCDISSDSDSDMVLVGTRGNSISDFLSDDTCDDEWLVVSELGEGEGESFVTMKSESDEQSRMTVGNISYKDMLLLQA